MADPGPCKQVFTQLAETARALGHQHRLELLQHVSQGERSVERLAQLTGLTVANASQHLLLLRRAGLAASRRDGKNVLYRLASDRVLSLMEGLGRVAEESNAEIRMVVADFFERLDTLEPVSREELAARVRAGGVTVLDARTEEEFALGHLPGAVNVPTLDLLDRLAELPKDREIVAYCRGAYCVLSFKVVSKLREMGFRARRLEQGFPEWRAAGLAVETGGTQAA